MIHSVGTGGFLIESFRHIYNTMPRTETTMNMLRENTIFGNEITNTARITKMNMILAGDGHSGINMCDSLANPVNGKYDVVLANMPYSQKTRYGNLYDLPSTNGDSICVQHCMRAINSTSENGRMAIVVPEGFLFRKDLAKTRELILNNCQLQSIISLPQGVFLPYTGVKTNIIYATKVNQKINSKDKKDNFWYFDVKSDGYTLDNHRRKMECGNDLDIYQEYRKLDNEQTSEMMDVGFESIPLDKVKENCYILVGSRYRETQDISSKFENKKISDISTLIRGVSFPKSAQKTDKSDNCVGIVTTKSAQSTGIRKSDIIYVDMSYSKNEKLLQKDDILISLANSYNLVGRVTFVNEQYSDLSFGAFMGLIRCDNKKVVPKLLFYLLQSHIAKNYYLTHAKTTTNISNLTFEDLANMELPIPPLHIQNQIVNELENYQNIIDGARCIVNNYKPNINIKDEWPKVKLPKIVKINGKSINPSEKYNDNKFTYIDLSAVENGTGLVNFSTKIIGNKAPSRARRLFDKGDILMSTVRPNLQAFAYADFNTKDCIASTGFAVLSPNENINGKFLFYMLFNEFVDTQLKNAMSKGMYPSINKSDLENLEIPLPSIDIQNRIVAEIEKEQKLIQPSKKIIELFTNKLENQINNLFK